MKATGIVRRMDDLGRVVIPKEIRRQMRIREGDPLEIYTENGYVCFKKYSPIGDFDFDQIKTICDTMLGRLNYTIYDRDGDAIVPKAGTQIDVDALGENICFIRCDGDLIGYIQSPSGNRELAASVIGNLIAD